MTGADLARPFGLIAFSVEQNTEGISHRESLVAPPGGNCMNWVLGHILAERSKYVFPLIGHGPSLSEEQAALYDRGSEPLGSGETALPFGNLLRIFGESQGKLMGFLEGKTDEDLSAPLREPNDLLGDTVGSALFAFSFHEAYHAGQIGTLRRLAGKPGALK